MKRNIFIFFVLILGLVLVGYDAGPLTALGVFLFAWGNNMAQKIK